MSVMPTSVEISMQITDNPWEVYQNKSISLEFGADDLIHAAQYDRNRKVVVSQSRPSAFNGIDSVVS